MTITLLLIAAYLIGSIPTAYIITKIVKKTDIREHGSGNPGATNVFRVAGPVPGVITFIIDILKGYLPVLFSIKYFTVNNPGYIIVVGTCALAGHITMPWMNFRGGKGVATGSGIFLALLPVPTLIAVGIFGIVLAITKYVSVSSLIATVSLPVSSFLLKMPKTYSYFALAMVSVVIYTHRSNIKRLISGNELKPVNKKGN